jgi:hypothetical protein
MRICKGELGDCSETMQSGLFSLLAICVLWFIYSSPFRSYSGRGRVEDLFRRKERVFGVKDNLIHATIARRSAHDREIALFGCSLCQKTCLGGIFLIYVQ